MTGDAFVGVRFAVAPLPLLCSLADFAFADMSVL
jgi:hypothetical protein